LSLINGTLDSFLHSSRNDAQTIIDIALEYTEFGFYQKAIGLLELHHENPQAACPVPNPMSASYMTYILLAWLYHMDGHTEKSEQILSTQTTNDFDYFFPSRLQEVLILEWLIRLQPDHSLAAYGLGNFYFNVKRHQDAIDIWGQATFYRCEYATLYRNLGIAFWNANNDGDMARSHFEQAVKLRPKDARIQFEYDQLRKKLNDDPLLRLEAVKTLGDLVIQRDDFSVELAALYNRTAQYEQALKLIINRKFHPWEGGEGQVLKQYSYACLKLGQQAMEANDPATALSYFNKSLNTPDNLGEKYHPLQAVAHINYWKGKAYRALQQEAAALEYFTQSATEQGDFIDMAVSNFSELTFYKALSLRELGNETEASALLEQMRDFANKKLKAKAKIDYFATSLPLLLVFEDDIQKKNLTEAYYLLGLAELGLGNYQKSEKHLKRVLQLHVMHIGAADSLTLVSNYKTETSK
ncbi:MAG: tetratricopeptide repeat protein, partial [Bacteroidota bacterium]